MKRRADELLEQIDYGRPAVPHCSHYGWKWAMGAEARPSRVAGHRAGTHAVREIVEGCAELHIPALTLYAFSVENWKRPTAEVSTLMSLLKEFLAKELATLVKNNVKLQTIGRTDELDATVRAELAKTIESTKGNTGTILTLALNYGGRAEIVDAVNRILCNGRKDLPEGITEQEFAGYLYTAGVPDPDLLIRTSGELRISNFLLWQIAYAEIWVTDTLWPDFDKKCLHEAIIAFQKRERRYGGIEPQLVRSR